MQGGKEMSSEYLCLENAALSPRLMNVMPGENGYPTEIEITLPASMTVVPFGSGEAEVVADKTTAPGPGATNRTAPAASSMPGTTSGRISRPAA